MTTKKYTNRRTASDVAKEIHKEIKEAQEDRSEEGLLLSEDFIRLIDELAALAAPRVTISLPLAEAIAEKLVEIGNGDGDARKLVPEVRALAQDLRDLILIQQGKD